MVALGTDGVQLYLRGRVTHAELTGHTWRPLTVPPPTPAAASRSGSVASLSSASSVPAASVPAAPTVQSDSPRQTLMAPVEGLAAAGGDTQSTGEAAGSHRDSDSSGEPRQTVAKNMP